MLDRFLIFFHVCLINSCSYLSMFGETEYDLDRQYSSININEQLEALSKAVKAGKVSKYHCQIVYTVAECCHHESIGLLAYNPLAMGIVSGKYLSLGNGPPDTRLNIFKGKYSKGESRYILYLIKLHMQLLEC
ncbi:uncharacterized protein LOC131646480 [Vicia villosa]|uniref:uncharacterized protein LOC131646480 n=1 Tax=Vicia villosa TaxID=3911 RepID=UPI00273C7C7C|nr:uncharacterized protein LOC131646480 [Vicia villosa]XP_058772491.1 uncharacterized protein LOC131646480 [Vicia villosa]